jgi:CheY-like chemotaxis protein
MRLKEVAGLGTGCKVFVEPFPERWGARWPTGERVIEIRCPSCEADLSDHPLGMTHCPVCGEELNITIDLREPVESTNANPQVLIVDDEREIRQLLMTVLEGSGFSVVAEVSNGPDAVLASQRLRPDYVFLDFFMPAISGEETARLIREVSPRSIIISFSAVLQEKPEWADAHLAKTDVGAATELLKRLATGQRS